MFRNKIYCGVKELSRGQRYGKPKECVEMGEARRYGLRRLSKKLADEAENIEENEDMFEGINIDPVEQMKDQLAEMKYEYEMMVENGYSKRELKKLEDEIFDLEDQIAEHDEDFEEEEEPEDDLGYYYYELENLKRSPQTKKNKAEIKRIQKIIMELEAEELGDEEAEEEYNLRDLRGYGKY